MLIYVTSGVAQKADAAETGRVEAVLIEGCESDSGIGAAMQNQLAVLHLDREVVRLLLRVRRPRVEHRERAVRQRAREHVERRILLIGLDRLDGHGTRIGLEPNRVVGQQRDLHCLQDRQALRR